MKIKQTTGSSLSEIRKEQARMREALTHVRDEISGLIDGIALVRDDVGEMRDQMMEELRRISGRAELRAQLEELERRITALEKATS